MPAKSSSSSKNQREKSIDGTNLVAQSVSSGKESALTSKTKLLKENSMSSDTKTNQLKVADDDSKSSKTNKSNEKCNKLFS